MLISGNCVFSLVHLSLSQNGTSFQTLFPASLIQQFFYNNTCPATFCQSFTSTMNQKRFVCVTTGAHFIKLCRTFQYIRHISQNVGLELSDSDQLLEIKAASLRPLSWYWSTSHSPSLNPKCKMREATTSSFKVLSVILPRTDTLSPALEADNVPTESSRPGQWPNKC